MSKYDTTLFQYFQNLKNQLKVTPLNLGGTAVSSGGPPGGFTGYLPQNRVGYDPYEAAISGFSSATPYNSSGILVDANLIDNLNHIRYRVTSLEELAFTGNYVSVKENEILVASGVTVLNFEGSVTVEETAPAEVTITITSSGTGVDTDEKAKVSANDTTASYLENKIVAGDNITITVLNDGSNETLEINSTASGVGGGLEGWYSPLDYGGVGDGTTDDTTAVANTIAAIPAAGGILYFPPGYNFKTSGGFTLSKPITVKGGGNSQDFDGTTGLSTVQCTVASGILFTVSAYGCSFEDIFLVNTSVSTPTYGSAVTVTNGGDLIHFKNITSHSFYTGIDIQDGFAWSLDHCFIVNCVKYGLKIQHIGFVDGGDQFINDCVFWADSRTSDAAIRYESGGGLKINNTKIVGSEQSDKQFHYGIDAYLGTSVVTSVFLVNNCSIENIDVNGIRFVTSASATSTFTGIIIDGVEIAMNDKGSGSAAIYMSNQATGSLEYVIIDNIIGYDWQDSITDEMIYLDGLNNVSIGTLLRDGFGGDVAIPNCTNVSYGSAGTILVSANDTTLAHLEDKIVGGTGITIATIDDGGNETLQISATGSGISTPSYQGVKVYNNANISIANNSATELTFNSEYWDTNNFHSTSSNTNRLTATISGYYQVGCMFKWDDSSVGVREAGFIKNSSTYFAYNRITPQAANTMVSFTETINLNVNDWVTLIVYQNRGSALNVVYGAEYTPNFWMNYLGSGL